MATATDRLFRLLLLIGVAASCEDYRRKDGICETTGSMSQPCVVLMQSASTKSHFGRSDVRQFVGSDATSSIRKSIAELAATLNNGWRAAFTSISRSSLAPNLFLHMTGLIFFKTLIIVVFVALLLAIVWFSLQEHPFPKSGSVESSARTSDGRSLSRDLLAQSKGDLRHYSRSRLPISLQSQATVRSNVSTPRDIENPERGAGRFPSIGASGQSASSGEDSENLPFCPDLIVPKHSECVLALPLDRPWSRASFSVSDVRGKTVLIVQPSVVGNLWASSIATENRIVLAKSCETRLPDDTTVFELMRAEEQCWAKLVYKLEDDRYLLTPVRGGVVWHFWGNFDNYAINITDETNRLFATTEMGPIEFDPLGKYFRLRVAPETDVGLALSGILCIRQHMEQKQRSA